MIKETIEGEDLVKPERKEEWKSLFIDYGKRNIFIRICAKIMRALSEGKSPEEVEKRGIEEITEEIIEEYSSIISRDRSISSIWPITYAQMGGIVEIVVYFHPRGEEFRQYWNRKYLSKKEATKFKGVVNPALFPHPI